jgi:hypothetical protein
MPVVIDGEEIGFLELVTLAQKQHELHGKLIDAFNNVGLFIDTITPYPVKEEFDGPVFNWLKMKIFKNEMTFDEAIEYAKEHDLTTLLSLETIAIKICQALQEKKFKLLLKGKKGNIYVNVKQYLASMVLNSEQTIDQVIKFAIENEMVRQIKTDQSGSRQHSKACRRWKTRIKNGDTPGKKKDDKDGKRKHGKR